MKKQKLFNRENSILFIDSTNIKVSLYVYFYYLSLLFLICFLCEHYLNKIGRVKYDVIDDNEAVDAFYCLSKKEGIIPALESSHAVAYALKLAKSKKYKSILVNLSGRGDKDIEFVLNKFKRF